MIASTTLAAFSVWALPWDTSTAMRVRQRHPSSTKTSAAPDVTPEEAKRAISNAKDLSTAFRVAADKVLHSVVTIETKSKPVGDEAGSVARSPRSNMQPRNPFAELRLKICSVGSRLKATAWVVRVVHHLISPAVCRAKASAPSDLRQVGIDHDQQSRCGRW